VGGWVVVCFWVGAAEASGRVDLRRFDWNNAVLPGSVCGIGHLIRLHSGYETAYSRRWPALSPIEAARGRVVFGDLSGVAGGAATLQIVCFNRGGTAARQLAFAVVVYSAGQHAPRALGVLTPRFPSRGRHVPILTPTAITHDRILLTELFYGSHDADCCPTGKAETAWRLRSETFRAVSTVVKRRPEK
jgi:hypothetical protein